MDNTRFATAIHILTILASEKDQWLSSEWIAGSVNVNPVVVRREMAVLKNAGFIESKQGKEGGSRLSKKSGEILISDIYRAIKNVDVLGKKNCLPNPDCQIGKNINGKLNVLFGQTDQVVFNFLQGITLNDFVSHF